MTDQEEYVASLDRPQLEQVAHIRWARIIELDTLLDNYRGDCGDCGRVNVLLEPNPGEYDSPTCLLDTAECERLHKERLETEGRAARLERAARHQRLADGTATRDDHWQENIDTMIRSTLAMQRKAFENLPVFQGLVNANKPVYWSRFDKELEKE